MVVIIQFIDFGQEVFGRDSPFTGRLIGSLVAGVIGLYVFVVVGCLDGTPGPNRFDPSPKRRGGREPDDAAKVFD